jgi:hypothetical protein
MAVTATVSPARVGLGDPFTLTVDAAVPHGAGSVQLLASPGPFEQVAAPRVSHAGGHVRLVETLVCVGRGCAPDATPRRVALPAPHATIGGTTVTGAAPVVTVVPRVPAAAVSASRAQFRQPTAIPAPTAPFGVAAATAIVLAVLLAAAAAWLVAGSRRKRPAPAGPPEPAGLPLALRLLRESARRAAPDRRRAADLVSRLAPPNAADDATRLAWAPPEPQPPEVERLADRIEQGAG